MKTFVIATENRHKLSEYAALLSELSGLRCLADFPPAPPVVEDGETFIANAILKAKAAYAHTGELSLADDSGFGVGALNWAPGVYSARYVPGSDQDRVAALLKAVGASFDRRARFSCALALAGLPEGTALPAPLIWQDGCAVVLDEVSGRLLYKPRGNNGFGYDPIFGIPDGRSFAELSMAEKNDLSHRGRAVSSFLPFLRTLLMEGKE